MNIIKLLIYEYPNWREIQSTLDKGRICPICGKIYKNHFLNHLSSHGLDQCKYLVLLYKLSEVPRCPICDNNCSINTHGYQFNNTCSSSYCMHSMSNYTRVSNGNHNFAYNGDPIHDDLKYKELHDKAMARIRRGDNILAYSGDPSHDKKVLEFHRWKLTLRDNVRYSGWHSRPENLLAEILSKLSIYYEREVEYNNQEYRVDYVLPDYRKILECDGMYKWNGSKLLEEYVIRARNIERITEFDVINIPSNYIYYYYKFPRKLWDIIKVLKYPPMIRTQSI
jgi:hypothetical protein